MSPTCAVTRSFHTKHGGAAVRLDDEGLVIVDCGDHGTGQERRQIHGLLARAAGDVEHGGINREIAA